MFIFYFIPDVIRNVVVAIENGFDVICALFIVFVISSCFRSEEFLFYSKIIGNLPFYGVVCNLMVASESKLSLMLQFSKYRSLMVLKYVTWDVSP